jgi:biofilm PGA synthesis N-glycosyltransferase PgaC
MTETSNTGGRKDQSYALVTAAYNEEKLIEKVILSIVQQTVTPAKWIIVSDGSTDGTDEIVRRYADRYSFIELHRITEDHPRNLTAQVNAINAGFARLKDFDCRFIGNLDADITLEPTYFERLLPEYDGDPRLGLAGGFIFEDQDGKFKPRRSNTLSSVAHAVQLFRRECLDALGGYRAFTWAGADWYAEVSLRMKGWHVRSIPELPAYHHRPTGKGFGLLRYWYRGGIMDFYMGTHPLFEIFRVVRRFREKPYVVGALVRFSAFLWAYSSRTVRQVPDNFMAFLRKEQMERLRLGWWGSKSAPVEPRAFSEDRLE